MRLYSKLLDKKRRYAKRELRFFPSAPSTNQAGSGARTRPKQNRSLLGFGSRLQHHHRHIPKPRIPDRRPGPAPAGWSRDAIVVEVGEMPRAVREEGRQERQGRTIRLPLHSSWNVPLTGYQNGFQVAFLSLLFWRAFQRPTSNGMSNVPKIHCQ